MPYSHGEIGRHSGLCVRAEKIQVVDKEDRRTAQRQVGQKLPAASVVPNRIAEFAPTARNGPVRAENKDWSFCLNFLREMAQHSGFSDAGIPPDLDVALRL
jgi:hypothetical protein